MASPTIIVKNAETKTSARYILLHGGKARTDDNKPPYHHGRTTCILQMRLRSIERTKRKRHTSPYRKSDGIPVMTLIMENETPKFYRRFS